MQSTIFNFIFLQTNIVSAINATTHTTKNDDALDTYIEHVNNSRVEISEFIATLSIDDKDRLLQEMLSVGRGSLDYAKKLLSDGDSNPSLLVDIQTKHSWCRCGICKPMATLEENKCCGKRTCMVAEDCHREFLFLFRKNFE